MAGGMGRFLPASIEEALERREQMRNESGRNTVPPGNLAEQVQYGYPITDMRMSNSLLWPTPRSRDWKGQTQRGTDAPGDGICNALNVTGGQLNPTWVEWLMGFPIGWTDLEASETQ